MNRLVLATTSIIEASQRPWDAIVIGAGPAGSVAAIRLARGARRVLLVDRADFPRGKACGCCLAPAAVAAIADLGLCRVLERQGAELIDAVDVRISGRRLEAPLRGGLSVSRGVLDAVLLREAIRCGADFLPACTAHIADAGRDSRLVGLSMGGTEQPARARLIIAAGGLGFGIRESAGLPVHCERRWSRSRLGGGTIIDGRGVDLPRRTVRMVVARHGYVGMVRVEEGRFAVAGAFDAAHVRACGSLGRAAADILEEVGQAVPAELEEARWLGAPHLTRRPRRVAVQRVLAVGDAAGFVEPFTGEGITWAVRSATAAAAIAEAFLDRPDAAWTRSVPAQWSRTHRRLVRAQQRRCRVIAEVLRHPALVRGALVAGRCIPRLARSIVDRVYASGAAEGAWPVRRVPAARGET